jgi:hypothetical protein
MADAHHVPARDRSPFRARPFPPPAALAVACAALLAALWQPAACAATPTASTPAVDKPSRVNGYIVHAPWLERPSAGDLEDAYPAFALELSIPGRADLDCLVLADGHLDCAIASEAPEARSFGGAALTVAHHFRMATTLPDGTRTKGARTRLTLTFTPPKPDPLNP